MPDEPQETGGAGDSPVSFWTAVEKIRERDKRYSPEAYAFVMDALDFAIRQIGKRRHVSALELLGFLCEFARSRYGVLAYSVLSHWGLKGTEDIGSVVYRLIDAQVLAEQKGDSPADFSGVFVLRRRLEDEYFESPHFRNPPDHRSA
jgi:uncharacterized repeat protein (TIGR04138 family)